MQISNKTKLDDLRFTHYDFFYGEIRPKLDEKGPVFLRFLNSFLLESDVRDICKMI